MHVTLRRATSPCSGPAYSEATVSPWGTNASAGQLATSSGPGAIDEGHAFGLLAATGAVEEPAACRVTCPRIGRLGSLHDAGHLQAGVEDVVVDVRGASNRPGSYRGRRSRRPLTDVVDAHGDAVHRDVREIALAKMPDCRLALALPAVASAEAAAGASPIRKAARTEPGQSFRKLRSACIENSSGLNSRPVAGGGGCRRPTQAGVRSSLQVRTGWCARQ